MWIGFVCIAIATEQGSVFRKEKITEEPEESVKGAEFGEGESVLEMQTSNVPEEVDPLWVKHTSRSNGKTFYKNVITKEARWIKPTADVDRVSVPHAFTFRFLEQALARLKADLEVTPPKLKELQKEMEKLQKKKTEMWKEIEDTLRDYRLNPKHLRRDGFLKERTSPYGGYVPSIHEARMHYDKQKKILLKKEVDLTREINSQKIKKEKSKQSKMASKEWADLKKKVDEEIDRISSKIDLMASEEWADLKKEIDLIPHYDGFYSNWKIKNLQEKNHELIRKRRALDGRHIY